MSSGEANGEYRVRPLDEQWPNLRFLGMGVWWAWIWLCFSSTVVTGLFPLDARPSYVLQTYLFSTAAIAAAMVVAGVNYRRVEPLLDRRGVVVGGGAVATVATLVLELSGLGGLNVLFSVAAVATGLGTSCLALRAGKLYGSVGLGESLMAGALSLVLAALLYFAGVALPDLAGGAFAACLPLAAAMLLSMQGDDSFDLVPDEVEHTPQEKAASTSDFRRVAAAAGVIAFTAGLGMGISTVFTDSSSFTDHGSIAALAVALVSIGILWAANRHGAEFSVVNAYVVLLVLGVVMMAAMCFGFPASYLSVGKESLCLILTLLMAYLSFRYSMSPVRFFGIGQAIYYLCSGVGWLAGYALSPLYGDFTTRVGVVLTLIVMVVLVMMCVLPTGTVRGIVRISHADRYVHDAEGAVPAADLPEPVAPRTADVAPANPYGRAADPLYGLSQRELEIMLLFAQGRSANWIAESECISKNTVRTHLRSVYAKLDVHTRQELLDFLGN